MSSEVLIGVEQILEKYGIEDLGLKYELAHFVLEQQKVSAFSAIDKFESGLKRHKIQGWPFK